MKVLVTGFDGYLGWPLTLELLKHGHQVIGVDSGLRRKLVEDVGSISATSILTMEQRISSIKDKHDEVDFFFDDISEDYTFDVIFDKHPDIDVVAHLAAQPSAPYSMMGFQTGINGTMKNNNRATANLIYKLKDHPKCRLVFASTMGEYGQPAIKIHQGFFDYSGENSYSSLNGMQFPREPPSVYHLSKVNDSNLIWLAHKQWGLKATILMQGIVYGTKLESHYAAWQQNRFDFDLYFGTVLHRFIAQTMVGQPMTLYGKGKQKRAMLSIHDCIMNLLEAIELDTRDFAVRNNVTNIQSIEELAQMVHKVGTKLGANPVLNHVDNPRKEKEDHFYDVEFNNPNYLHDDFESDIMKIFNDLRPFKLNINRYKNNFMQKK